MVFAIHWRISHGFTCVPHPDPPSHLSPHPIPLGLPSVHWRRKWQPTPVFLPGESQGWGSLVGCRLWGRRVGHDWRDLAAAYLFNISICLLILNSNFSWDLQDKKLLEERQWEGCKPETGLVQRNKTKAICLRGEHLKSQNTKGLHFYSRSNGEILKGSWQGTSCNLYIYIYI